MRITSSYLSIHLQIISFSAQCFPFYFVYSYSKITRAVDIWADLVEIPQTKAQFKKKKNEFIKGVGLYFLLFSIERRAKLEFSGDNLFIRLNS